MGTLLRTIIWNTFRMQLFLILIPVAIIIAEGGCVLVAEEEIVEEISEEIAEEIEEIGEGSYNPGDVPPAIGRGGNIQVKGAVFMFHGCSCLGGLSHPQFQTIAIKVVGTLH